MVSLTDTVDHAGDTVGIIHPITGEARPTYIFVAVLGASNYTYAEATWTRDLTGCFNLANSCGVGFTEPTNG